MLHKIIISLIKKEFLSVLMDKKSRAQIFIAPFIMLFIFSFTITMNVENASLGVLNLDNGELGRQFTSMFEGGPAFTRILHLRETQDIKPVIDNQEALMVVVIPRNFSAKLLLSKPVSIQTILDGRKTNAARIANGYALQIAETFGRTISKKNARINIVTRQLFNPNLEYIWFTMPILLILLTQMLAIMISGLSIARERELGTFEQLLVSPLSSTEIIIGKAVPAVCIAFAQGILIHLVSIYIFGVPFTGNIALLAASMLLYISAVTGVGLFISSLCSTQQQAFLGSFIFMVPSVLLSGFAAPIANMPAGLQTLTCLNPTRHIITITLGLYLKDIPFADITGELASLTGIAAATLIFAGWFFKRRVQ